VIPFQLRLPPAAYAFPLSFSGNFEPPGAVAVSTFVTEYEKELDPRWQAVKAAEIRAERAERAAIQAPAGKVVSWSIPDPEV
jgi:hypothetical protein